MSFSLITFYYVYAWGERWKAEPSIIRYLSNLYISKLVIALSLLGKPSRWHSHLRGRRLWFQHTNFNWHNFKCRLSGRRLNHGPVCLLRWTHNIPWPIFICHQIILEADYPITITLLFMKVCFAHFGYCISCIRTMTPFQKYCIGFIVHLCILKKSTVQILFISGNKQLICPEQAFLIK